MRRAVRALLVVAVLAVVGVLAAGILRELPRAPPRAHASAAPPATADAVARLVVRVVDDAGDATPAARVRVIAADGARDLARSTTDARGEARVAGLEGHVRVIAEHDDAGLGASEPLAAPADGADATVVVVLARARRVSGRVIDEAGAPIAAAEVRLDAGAPWLARAARTTADGAFALPLVTRAAVRVSARAAGLDEAGADVAAGGDVESLVVRLSRAPRIAGSVVDEVGGAVAGAVVRACDDVPGRTPERAVADDQGAFSLAGATDGCVAIASHPLHAPSEPVAIARGRALRLVVRRGGAIAGRIVDARGAPLAACRVALEGFESADGRATRAALDEARDAPGCAFTWPDLAPGSYVLGATADGRAHARSRSVVVVAGRTTDGVTIVVTRARARGVVSDAATRAPIAGARVAVAPSWSASLGATAAEATTDAQGAYELAPLPEGPVTLSVRADGYDVELVAGVVATDGEARRDVALRAVAPGARPAMAVSGIGATLGADERGVFVSGFADGAPAAVAGLRAGDVIRSVDGADARGKPMSALLELLRGTAGTDVAVDVHRDDGDATVVIRRDRVVWRGR